MKRRPKPNENNMKIRILLTIIGAVALAAITFNVNAGNVLLTPRDGGNQTKIAPGISDRSIGCCGTNGRSSRAGNQTATVAGKETTAIKCSAIGSRNIRPWPAMKPAQAAVANPAAFRTPALVPARSNRQKSGHKPMTKECLNSQMTKPGPAPRIRTLDFGAHRQTIYNSIINRVVPT